MQMPKAVPMTTTFLHSAARACWCAAAFLAAITTHAQPAREKPTPDITAPLGSITNPVRAKGPIGQLDYLMRLRCRWGDAPTFERLGRQDDGPYGHPLDRFSLKCGTGETHEILMDMHHTIRLTDPVPGLVVLAEHPARVATGCPPKIEGFAPGIYAFHFLEVEKPVKFGDFKADIDGLPAKGVVFVKFIIESDGSVPAAGIEYPPPGASEALRAQATRHLTSQRFTPAEHKAGCKVAQRSETRLRFR
jgi:hypothetical protein